MIGTSQKAVAAKEIQKERLRRVLADLLEYCSANDWAGFDPYDALNSRIFAYTPFAKSRLCRIAVTQIMKRLLVNIRPLLLIEKEQNPKAIALFLMAVLKLQGEDNTELRDHASNLIEILVRLRSLNFPYWCWGYSFPWQTRTILVPRGAPNLVCTAFVANALLDAYERLHDERCLTMAVSAANYILKELYWPEDEETFCFRYPLPTSSSKVHNANFLGAALFYRIFKHTGDKSFLGPAQKIARYSAGKQNKDGSWNYGEHSTQRWIDNFHTGYNLCSLKTIIQIAGNSEFEPYLVKGYEYYIKHFFNEDGAPKYFHDRIYPIDIHSVAQSIITLISLRDLDQNSLALAHSVYGWAMKHMWDDRGYFYYQVLPYFTNKISYMRWSQAWMFLALSTILSECDKSASVDGNMQY